MSLLHPCPAEGSGVHFWVFGAACTLRRAGWSDAEIYAEIEAKCVRKDPREIAEAVKNSVNARTSSSNTFRALPGRPRKGVLPKKELDNDAVKRIGYEYGGMEMLGIKSKVDPKTWSTEQLIDALFRGEDLLCMGTKVNTAETWEREKWRGKESTKPLMVPSPMVTKSGINKAGDASERCLNNTGPRRYLVIESDSGTEDEKASVMLHLAGYGPLAMVVSSGKRSLHGWFYCEGVDESIVYSFHEYAVSLGADPATWVRCQLIRTPGAIRPETGKEQEVLYLNPKVVPSFPPEGYCPGCWTTNRFYLINSRFPCRHNER